MKLRNLGKVALALAVAVGTISTVTSNQTAHAAASQLVVDLSTSTGPVLHGASGFLYGIAQDGVPSDNLVAGIKPTTFATKPPGGTQHPENDADKVAPQMVRAGAKQIFVYMQDIYDQWPYQNNGLTDYISKVDTMVQTLKADPYHSYYVYIPFNEPDWIWYNYTTLEQNFFNDWLTVYREIKRLDPTAPIAGPNTSNYNSQFMSDFMTFCKANNCLPEIVSWHDLGSDPQWFPYQYSNYRSLEQSLGITPRQISITEYAGSWQTSNPGQMIGWLSSLENSKVYGNLAFWNGPNNLDNLATKTNSATGLWWLYNWYGNMTGDTVALTPNAANPDGPSGVATLDSSKQQAVVLFGRASGNNDVLVKGFSSVPYFGSTVHVTVYSTAMTGYEGVAQSPAVELDGDYSVTNGQIDVVMPNMDPNAAYKMIITPSVVANPYLQTKPWSTSVEAENATIADAQIANQGGGNEASSGKFVNGITNNDSSVTFNVNVPNAGTYALDIRYANGNGDIQTQYLQVNGGSWSTLTYKPDAAWQYWNVLRTYVNLNQGTNSITLAKYVASLGPAKGNVDLDRIDLTYLTPASSSVTEQSQRYEAENASLSSGLSNSYANSGYSQSGYVTGFTQSGSNVEFHVNVQKDGYYNLGIRYAAQPVTGETNDRNLNLLISGTQVQNVTLPNTWGLMWWNEVPVVAYLQAGINRINLASTGVNSDVSLDCLDVTPINGNTGAIKTYEAESSANTFGGAAVASANGYASGGQDAEWIGAGAANYLQFNNVNVPTSGTYKLIIAYSNAEKNSSNNYNTNPIDRSADVSVNGGSSQKYYFRNTWSYNSFDTVVVNVNLNSGNNTIKLSNSTGYAPNIDYIQVAPSTINAGNYEAESTANTLSGAAVRGWSWTASGTQTVGWIGNGAGNTLQFNNVNVPVSGTYNMVVYYTANDNRSANISVNGAPANTVQLTSTDGWSNFNTQIVPVNLNAGNNTILFSNPTSYVPDIDKIQILTP